MTEPGKVITARGLAAELETSYHCLSKWPRQQRDAGHRADDGQSRLDGADELQRPGALPVLLRAGLSPRTKSIAPPSPASLLLSPEPDTRPSGSQCLLG